MTEKIKNSIISWNIICEKNKYIIQIIFFQWINLLIKIFNDSILLNISFDISVKIILFIHNINIEQKI